MLAYMIGNDGELNGIARIQIVAVSLNLRHVEEKLLSFLNFIVQKSELSFDGINDGSFLLANSSYLNIFKH